MEDAMPEYVGDVSVRYVSRPEDVPNELEFNHSLMAQCEIDSLRSEILNLQDQRDLAMKVIERLERERDEAREELKHIGEYGTEEINAAIDLRQKLASALVERDEAQKQVENQKVRIGEFFAALEKLNSERDEAREKYTTLLTDNMLDVHKLYKAIELIKSLINQIERPAYGVDEAVAKMFLMEEAKKFSNEVQQM